MIWDAGGNLTQRVNVVDSNETENFQYDFLDRLTGVSGAYSESYAYNQIGNITCKALVAAPCSPTNYTYTSGKPHAVTNAAGTAYTYDANGNMTTRGSQTLTWDVEDRLTGVTGSATFVYDGDGKRVKKTEGGQTTVYVNKYYEKRIGSPDEITLYYYLGDRLVALKKGTTLRYVSQDHLTGTSVTSDTSGNLVASIKYMPFGTTRAATGTLETDIKFTGQRLDSGVDLYYYGARYYDANIGRFISADTIVPSLWNPQTLNRYSYALNNPLRYIDPSGHDASAPDWNLVQGNDGKTYWAIGNPTGATPVSPENLTPGNYGLLPSGAGSSASTDGGGGVGPAMPVSAPAQPAQGSGGDGGDHNVGAAVLEMEPLITCGPLCWIIGGVVIIGTAVVTVNWGDIVENITSGVRAIKDKWDGILATRAPGVPTAKDGYYPPKNWDGHKVRAPDSDRYGYPDRYGDVWVPTGTGDAAHGGPHWDVESRGGGHRNVRPQK